MADQPNYRAVLAWVLRHHIGVHQVSTDVWRAFRPLRGGGVRRLGSDAPSEEAAVLSAYEQSELRAGSSSFSTANEGAA